MIKLSHIIYIYILTEVQYDNIISIQPNYYTQILNLFDYKVRLVNRTYIEICID